MVYFEELRLILILVMAYFSYRRLSNTSLDAIDQNGESI